jgi:hypothetical protein
MNRSMERLTDYSISDEESIMDIRSELLDPIVSSSYRYTFRLDASSFLDKNSMLLFKQIHQLLVIQMTYALTAGMVV